jgi:hypothetical protein
MFDEETTMKTFIGTAVVLVGTMFGVSNAMANPSVGCGCSFVLRNGTSVATFFFGTGLEHVEITLTESGNVNADCKVDLASASGGAVTWIKATRDLAACSPALAAVLWPQPPIGKRLFPQAAKPP